MSTAINDYSARNIVVGQPFTATQDANFKDATNMTNEQLQGMPGQGRPNIQIRNRDQSPLMKAFGEKLTVTELPVSRPQYQLSGQSSQRNNLMLGETSPMNLGSNRTFIDQLSNGQPLVQPFNIPVNSQGTPKTSHQIPIRPVYQPFLDLGSTSPANFGRIRGVSGEKNTSEHIDSEVSTGGKLILNGGDSSIISS